MKNESGRRFTVRLDEETERLLTTFASQRKIDPSKAVREAIKLAANVSTNERIADHLEEIERRLSDMPTLAKNMLSLSAQMGDMAAANNTNTDRITGVLKVILEKTEPLALVAAYLPEKLDEIIALINKLGHRNKQYHEEIIGRLGGSK